jgi:hypothetical protein
MQQMHSTNYFQWRATQERAAAQSAADERAARAHRELADRYADRATHSSDDHFSDGLDDSADRGILSSDFLILP